MAPKWNLLEIWVISTGFAYIIYLKGSVHTDFKKGAGVFRLFKVPLVVLKNRMFRVFYRQYEQKLAKEIGSSEIPLHVAVIMDGNRRFAGKYGKSRSFGHSMGAETTEKVIEWCYEIGVKQLTLYAFSTENFQRSEEEVDGLFELIDQKFQKLQTDPRTHKKRMRVRVIGDRVSLPTYLLESIKELERRTESYEKFILNVAIAYGGRQDIIQAVREIAGLIKQGELSLKAVNEELISKYLYPSPDLAVPNVDLIIRTGGDERVSNFLPWQANGSECAAYFCAPYWPEFRKIDLLRSVRVYQARKAERKQDRLNRFAKVSILLRQVGEFEKFRTLKPAERQGLS